MDALAGSEAVRREAAIARIAVIGPRAIDRLIAAYGRAPAPDVKVCILRALEGIGDSRALPVACHALQGGGDAAVAAAAVLRPLLNAANPTTAATALDALVEVTLDPLRERRVRLAAYNALRDIPSGMLAGVTEVLNTDVEGAALDDAALDALFNDAADGRLPDDPAELRSAVAAKGATAPLTSLQKLIDAMGTRERSATGKSARAAWQQARGTAHQALALRGSRIALYDLRETFEASTTPLPPSFLAAMRVVGDATCIEALAAALVRAPEGDLWWRHQLASALRAIARRERITRRHPSMKRVLARWPQAADALT